MKDESWVAWKYHFILDVVQSALKTRQFMSSTEGTSYRYGWH